MYSLWCVHEHLPRVSSKRRIELWRHLFGADRNHPGSHAQSAEVFIASLLIDTQWFLYECLPGQDQHPRADLCLAQGHVRRTPAAVREIRNDEGAWLCAGPSRAISCGAGRRGRSIAAAAPFRSRKFSEYVDQQRTRHARGTVANLSFLVAGT